MKTRLLLAFLTAFYILAIDSTASADDTKLYDLFESIHDLTPKNISCNGDMVKEEEKPTTNSPGYIKVRCVPFGKEDTKKVLWSGMWIMGDPTTSQPETCVGLHFYAKKDRPFAVIDASEYFSKNNQFVKNAPVENFLWQYDPKTMRGELETQNGVFKNKLKVFFYDNKKNRSLEWEQKTQDPKAGFYTSKRRFNSLNADLELSETYSASGLSNTFVCDNKTAGKTISIELSPIDKTDPTRGANLSLYFESVDGKKLIGQKAIADKGAKAHEIENSISTFLTENMEKYKHIPKNATDWAWAVAGKCYGHKIDIQDDPNKKYADVISDRSKEIAADFSEFDFNSIKDLKKKSESSEIKPKTTNNKTIPKSAKRL